MWNDLPKETNLLETSGIYDPAERNKPGYDRIKDLEARRKFHVEKCEHLDKKKVINHLAGNQNNKNNNERRTL